MLNEKVGSTDQHYFYRLLADLRNRKKTSIGRKQPPRAAEGSNGFNVII
jgi:hypothetical protein